MPATPPDHPHRFRPSDRIRRRPEFQQVYDRGLKTHGRLMTVFLLRRADEASRLGIAATRKMGGAVQRNRAKRLIRDIFRRHRRPEGYDVVVVPRSALLDATRAAIEADYAACLERRSGRSRPGR